MGPHSSFANPLHVCSARVLPILTDGLPAIEATLDDGSVDITDVNPCFVKDHTDLENQTGWVWDFDSSLEIARELETFCSEHETIALRWEGGSFDIAAIAADVEGGTKFRMGHDKVLWWMVRGVFRPGAEPLIRQRVHTLLNRHNLYRPAHVNTVLRFFIDREMASPLPDQPDAALINCRNGMVAWEWESAKATPHPADGTSIVQIPVDVKLGATCPTIERFLREALQSESLDFIYEVLGYFLLPGNPLRKAFMLEGPSGSGKSTLLKLLRSLVGPRNCAAIPLQDFGGNRFASAQLYGKLANICGDVDSAALNKTARIKQITGGDLIQAEHKGRDSFTFTAFAKLIFSANEPPLSADQSDAYYTRWIVIPFPKAISEDQQNIFLDRELTGRPELEGLLVNSLDGLRRLMSRGRFELPESIEAATHRYRTVGVSASAFADAELVEAPGVFTARGKVLTAYQAFCKRNGYQALSPQAYYDWIRRNLAIPVDTHHAGEGKRCIVGYGLRPDSES